MEFIKQITHILETARKRILEFIEKQGIKPSVFLEKTDLKKGFIDKSHSDSGATDIHLSKILEAYPELSAEWLLTGKGDMITPSGLHKSTEPISVYKMRTDANLEHQHIPLYDIEATLGVTSVFKDLSSKEPIDYMYIPNAPKCDGAIFASGDSMYPLIQSGDIISYKIITDFANDIYWGEKYILSIDMAGDEFITTKFVQKSEKGSEYIKLVSQNKHHQDKDVPLKKIRSMALVKLVIRFATTR